MRSRPARTEAPATRSITEVAELERQVLSAVNAVRKEHGLVALRLNRALGDAALGHTRSMAEHGFFRHASYDGSAFWRRIKPVYKPVQGRFWGAERTWSGPRRTSRPPRRSTCG